MLRKNDELWLLDDLTIAPTISPHIQPLKHFAVIFSRPLSELILETARNFSIDSKLNNQEESFQTVLSDSGE